MSVGDRPESGGSRLTTIDAQPTPRRSLSSRLSLLHVVAIVSGLLAFLLILSWMRSQQELVEVAIATEEIRSGNVVTAGSFDFIEVPADGSFEGRLTSPEDAAALVGSVATRFIAPGDPILDSDLRPIETPEGLRAMSLPLELNRAVGGVLAVGDRVDIIGFDDAGARYIASDVAVLGIPGESSSAFGAGASYAITVAVNDVQALALAEALEFSDLHVLRSTGAPEVTLERLEAPGDEAEPVEGDAGGDG